MLNGEAPRSDSLFAELARPWLVAATVIVVAWALWGYLTGDGTTLYNAGRLAIGLVTLCVVNWQFIRNARDVQLRAGAQHAMPSWRASNNWTATSFDVNRIDYDPEGSAWLELVEIARSHGYELGPDRDPTDSARHFVRTPAANG